MAITSAELQAELGTDPTNATVIREWRTFIARTTLEA